MKVASLTTLFGLVTLARMKPLWPLTLALLLAIPCLAGDAPQTAVKITKVLHERQPQRRESMLNAEISPNDVGKFKELRQEFAPKPDGEYFTVIWRTLSREPLQHVSVTLYFRQLDTLNVQSGTIEMEKVRRGTTYSQFQIIGDAYRQGGAITAWNVIVSADGQTLDSFHSFLWKDPS